MHYMKIRTPICSGHGCAEDISLDSIYLLQILRLHDFFVLSHAMKLDLLKDF